MTSPKITVFIAAYNEANFIEKSISSILNQTFSDFEIIIVNDGSTDDTVAVIEGFTDSRIKLLHNDGNKGIVYTRNRLLELAKGEFIAVLDSDDIACPERLELQYNFLSSNPQIALCGGHAEIIDEFGVKTGKKFIEPTDDTVDMFMLFGNPFVNSTTMFRTSVFRELKGYNNYFISEDFDLFMRISEKYGVANIDKTLVYYRIHSNNTSTLHANIQTENEHIILSNMQRGVGLIPNKQSLAIHFELFSRNLKIDQLAEYLNFLAKLKTANQDSKRYDTVLFEIFLFKKWIEILKAEEIKKFIPYWYFKKELFSKSFLTFKHARQIIKNSVKQLFA